MSPERDDEQALFGLLPVSRETLDRLHRYVDLVRKWQPAENLVAPATLSSIWIRHVADSAQLAALFPNAKVWIDLGSGGGFPGVVIACFLADIPEARVHFVESNARKCAFLRRAIAETGSPGSVHHLRIEDFVVGWRGDFDFVTARALAPLSHLLALSAPLLTLGRRAAFPKGRDFQREIDEATKSWDFDLVIHKSRIEEGSVILEISRLTSRTGQTVGQGQP